MSSPETERVFAGTISEQNEDEEVANDAMQLVVIATFTGFCRLIAALARNGLLSPDQLANIHDIMTTPLDNPDWRDDSFIASTRNLVEKVLARAMSDARANWKPAD